MVDTFAARVWSLHAYPIKGCAGTEVDKLAISAYGPAHDREFLIIRPDGKFLTQREFPPEWRSSSLRWTASPRASCDSPRPATTI
ncbi:MOSC N-terminal beta barrel domain-containing protein [Fodinicola feengrottensis]|uniref:MOSC N-terminal beta barrel domain-containing protein n=1 Tax=Fodinicola feengrottensis TaxID=435914 RepID=UPI0013D7F9FA|nr:MOSC N-terminal beta barrel domain-containing protein [Fodinicola feengrottensis]